MRIDREAFQNAVKLVTSESWTSILYHLLINKPSKYGSPKIFMQNKQVYFNLR